MLTVSLCPKTITLSSSHLLALALGYCDILIRSPLNLRYIIGINSQIILCEVIRISMKEIDRLFSVCLSNRFESTLNQTP